MKKIIYIFLLVAGIVFISSRTTSKTEIADNAKNTNLKESNAALKSSDDSPRIHFLLHKNPSQSNLSPALWWSYEPSKKDGC
jgi:sortase (surface protein transpeptidase)